MSNSFKCVERAREMAQKIRAYTALTEVHNTSNKWLTTVCKSRSRKLDIIFSPLWATAVMCINTHNTHIHIPTFKKKNLKRLSSYG